MLIQFFPFVNFPPGSLSSLATDARRESGFMCKENSLADTSRENMIPATATCVA